MEAQTSQLGVVVHAGNPSSLETYAEGLLRSESPQATHTV